MLKRTLIIAAFAAALPALAAAQTPAHKFGMTVNPDDSGYHEVVTENPYQGKPAGARTPLTSKFRPVINPDDSGYLGPVDPRNAP